MRRTPREPRRERDPHGAYAHLRSGVLSRLHQAERLLPAELHLLVVEGYRPPALQRAYFDAYLAELRAQHRDWDAVDLTLTDADGPELDLGTRLNASPEERGGACFTDAPGLGPATGEARGGRSQPSARLRASMPRATGSAAPQSRSSAGNPVQRSSSGRWPRSLKSIRAVGRPGV
ncbi:hypothetical protein GTY78_26725 [Streptomyces sp. SID4934]|uniref:hypothetical protein n=1 Tax=unclassified Streptomyces TaxID=2593676 RepID=UPI00081D954C|nr:hypothetical protein [Streptomyces sp. SID4934]SCE43406.1 hypothetical protein GA0115237_114739 [Streptomyces sp. ScaeMP-6W]